MNMHSISELWPKIQATIFASTVNIVIYLAVFVLLIVAQWMILAKAGEKGWKILIPFYGTYTMYKICWKTMWFWIVLACCVVCGILLALIPAVGFILFIAVVIFAAVIEIIQICKLSKAFGHGGGYAVGLIFLPEIFYPIIGFGKSQYVGKAE